MNEHTAKRLIAFTSQSLKQHGIRAVRMDAIARGLNVSKRTIYKTYGTKDNLINSCLESYTDRTQNMFQIIKYSNPHPVSYLLELSRAFIHNLYKAECIFWTDITTHYQHIYTSIQGIWLEELGKSILTCQEASFVSENLNAKNFLHSFATMLYHARTAGCSPDMLYDAAYFMLKGTMTANGIKGLNASNGR